MIFHDGILHYYETVEGKEYLSIKKKIANIDNSGLLIRFMKSQTRKKLIKKLEGMNASVNI